jgi:hypothetical protein
MKTKSITKATLLSVFVLSVITAVTLNSCQKESIKPRIVNTSAKSTGSSAQVSALVVNDINNLIFSVRKSQKGIVPGGTDSNACTIITRDTISKPNSITYNYGSNCIGNDGVVRSGSVVVTYADPDIRLVNNVITATMQNYSVNGTQVNGQVSVTNIGPNGNNNLVLLETATLAKQGPQQVQPDSLNANFAYEWIAGASSSPAQNWQFSITGGWTNSFVTGQSDSLVITTPLIKNAKNTGCNFTIQGTQYTVTKTPQGLQYVYEDFGNPGGCTGQVSVTKNGVTTVQNQ